jgi:hypothetical protein
MKRPILILVSLMSWLALETQLFAAELKRTDNPVPSYVDIPDANFRAVLKELYPSCFNASDQMDINCSAVTSATSLDVSGKNITSLDGVQYFTNLTRLWCYQNELTSLPPLPATLTDLTCSQNRLTSLPALPAGLTDLISSYNDISVLPPLPSGLVYMDVGFGGLTALPALPATLKYADFGYTIIHDFPVLPAGLTTLYCGANTFNSFPTSLPPGLINLQCHSLNLTSLPALPSTLVFLHCANNKLTSLPELPAGLEGLYVYNNNLTSLPTLPSGLKVLQCNINGLTELPTLPSSLNNLNADKNDLDFADLELIGPKLVNFTVSPQIHPLTPSSVAVAPGGSISLDATVAGSDNHYQWYKNDAPISGATNPVFTKTNLSGTDTGLYSCIITSTAPNTSGIAIHTKDVAVDVRLDQTVTFNSLPAKKFGDAAFDLNATSSSGLPITFSSSNSLVATISGNTITIVGAGSSTITASQAGDNNFRPATDQQIQVVTKADQTITFDPLPAKVYGDVAFALTGTSSSALALTYMSSNTAIATISGNTLTIVGVGTVTITAKQAGNTNYNAAANVPQTLTVTKGDQAITFNALPAKNFGDAAFTLGATASSGLTVTYGSSNPAVATISGKTVTIKGVGTTTITASQSGNTKYNAAPNQTQDLVVNKKSQTITFAAIPAKTYGGAAFNLAATSSSGLAVSYASSDPSIATVNGKTVTIVGAGICTITASQSGNGNYAAAPDVPRQLTVNKASQTVTLNAIPAKTYGDAPFTVSATSSTGLPVTYSSSKPSVATVNGNVVTIVGAGTASIIATQAGNSNYNAASNGKALTVAKATQTITFGQLPGKNYGDAPFNLSATSSSGLPITYVSSVKTVATVTGNIVKIVGVGSTTITATQPGNLNYMAAISMNQPLVVSKGNPVITFDPLPDKNFGDPAFTLNATSTSTAAITFNSSDITIAKISTKTVTMLKAGTVTITASQPANTLWNSASKTQPLNVLKKSQTITFNALPVKTYGDPSFTLSATSSSGLAVSFASSDLSVATVSGNTVTLTGPGVATITASQAGNATYAAASNVPQNLTVKVPPPTDPASFVTVSNVTASSFKIDCFPGDGSKRLFVIKPTTPTGFFSPADNTAYAVGFVSAGSQVVSNDASTSVTVTGLTADTQYYVKVFEFNQAGPSISYLVAGAGSSTTHTLVASGRASTHVDQHSADELPTEFNVKVFSNPFKERLSFVVESPHAENASISLMDTNGKIVQEFTDTTNKRIDLDTQIANGVYILHVRTRENYKAVRVVRMD